MFALAILVGLIESTMARLRLVRVPQLLVGATALSGLALVLEFGGLVNACSSSILTSGAGDAGQPGAAGFEPLGRPAFN